MKRSILLVIILFSFISFNLCGCSWFKKDNEVNQWQYDENYHWQEPQKTILDYLTFFIFYQNEPEYKSHKFVDRIILQPTYEEEGLIQYTCSVCGYTKTQIMSKVTCSHDSSYREYEVKNEVLPDCTHDGGYDYVVYCRNCDKVILTQHIVLWHHHELIYHSAQEPTCTEIGWKSYNTCANCDYTSYEEIAPLDHNMMLREQKFPNCTEDGYEIYKCSRCDYTTTTTTPLLHHNYVEYVDEDMTFYRCSRCAAHFDENKEVLTNIIEAGGHLYSRNWQYDEDTHYHNSISNHSLKLNVESHNYDSWNTVVPATDSENGLRERTCKVCGYVQSEVINYLGSANLSYPSFINKQDETEYMIFVDSCSDTDILIHLIYRGCPITKIKGEGFRNYISLNSIMLASDIKYIGPAPFANYTNLNETYYSNARVQFRRMERRTGCFNNT